MSRNPKPRPSPSDAFARAAEQARAGRDLDAKLLLAAGISELGEALGTRVVVTGGTTVDFYAAETVDSAGPRRMLWKPSVDLDVVTLAPDTAGAVGPLRRALKDAGFKPADPNADPEAERGWLLPDVPIPVEVIAQTFHGDPARIVELDVAGHAVRLRGPEDTLFEHVEWGAHTRDQRSWSRALAVAHAQRESLDLVYLRKLAAERGFADALERCLRLEPLV